MSAIHLSSVGLSQRISMRTDQMCCSHLPRIYHTIVHGQMRTQPPSKGSFQRHRINYFSLLRYSSSHSNLWKCSVSITLCRTVVRGLAQIRSELHNNWRIISMNIPFKIKPSTGSPLLLRHGFLNNVFVSLIIR
jgi:hypothetical protein